MHSIKFISYTGKYPSLCNGELILEIDGKNYSSVHCIVSGGRCEFNEEYSIIGPWSFDVEYFKMTCKDKPLPELEAEDIKKIEELINEHIPLGCCGGCL